MGNGADEALLRAPQPQVPVLAGGEVGVEPDVEGQRVRDAPRRRAAPRSSATAAGRGRTRGDRGTPPAAPLSAWSTTCHDDAATTSGCASRKSSTTGPRPGTRRRRRRRTPRALPRPPRGPGCGPRTGRPSASVRTTAHPAVLGRQAVEHRGGVVRRAVVHDDQLEAVDVLGQDRRGGPADLAGAVVRRHDHAQEDRHGPLSISARPANRRPSTRACGVSVVRHTERGRA